MRALLLAAGFGKRLRPITNTIPKCLVTIHGVPLLEIWLTKIFNSDITRVVINLHYLPGPVKKYIETSQWRAQIDLFDEPVLLGTGGTLIATRKLLGNGPILVIHADNLSSINLKAFYAEHINRPKNCLITMALFQTDTPECCGIVELDQENRVILMHEKIEKPPGKTANAAIYILDSKGLDQIEAMKHHAIDISTQIIPNFFGRIYGYHINDYHRDIGSPSSLLQAHREMTHSKIIALTTPNQVD